MRKGLKTGLSVAIVALGIIPATAHAVHAKREEARAKRDLGAMTSALLPTIGDTDATPGVRDVTLNGARIFFKRTTENRRIDDVMKAIAKECENPDHDLALGIAEARERDGGETKAIKLERVVSQDADPSVKASLCVFSAEENVGEEGNPHREPLRRVRYTLAHEREDGTTSVTTISTASSTPLAELFPAEGDSPGSDIAEIARPESSRRTLTAQVGTSSGRVTKRSDVRVYESDLPTEKSIASYDAAMLSRGFETTASLAEGRMYRRDGKSFVVSFRGTTAGSTVTISQFE